jgi:hypothetical protein
MLLPRQVSLLLTAPASPCKDEGVFTTPWTATLTYVPEPDVMSEGVCADNIHQYYYRSECPARREADF